MSSRKKGNGTVLFAILVAVALLMFLGILEFKSDDMNSFFNLLRDLWK